MTKQCSGRQPSLASSRTSISPRRTRTRRPARRSSPLSAIPPPRLHSSEFLRARMTFSQCSTDLKREMAQLGLHRRRPAVRPPPPARPHQQDPQRMHVSLNHHLSLILDSLNCSRAHVVVFPHARSFLWGVVVILTVVIESYQGLVVQRVFLGLLEVRIYRPLSSGLNLTRLARLAVVRLAGFRHDHDAMVQARGASCSPWHLVSSV